MWAEAERLHDMLKPIVTRAKTEMDTVKKEAATANRKATTARNNGVLKLEVPGGQNIPNVVALWSLSSCV